MSNVGIFIDYDNISICLEKYYELNNDKGRKDLKTKLINKIKEKYENDKIVTFKAFADFQKISSNLTILEQNQIELRHVYSSNQRKNASDIALAVDVVKSLFLKNIIDKYVLISSDSDMLPVINEIKHFARDIVVVYSKYGSVEGYESYNSEYIIIEDLLNINEYTPINKTLINNNIDKYIEVLNEGICYIYKKHNNTGTANKSNLSEYIFIKENITRNDALLIVERMLKLGYIYESKINGSTYNKILISESNIRAYNGRNDKEIKIPSNIIRDKDFQKH